jgi:hypothetical protein
VRKISRDFHLNPYVERPLIVGKIVVARTAVAALASAAAAAVVVVEAFVGRVLCTHIKVKKQATKVTLLYLCFYYFHCKISKSM